MTSTRREPPRPDAESVRPEDVLQRILDARGRAEDAGRPANVKPEEAWTVLRETILTPPRQTLLPRTES